MHGVFIKVHRWAGLIAGIAILILAVTGCVLVFETDIERALNASVMTTTPGPDRVSLDAAVASVRASYPSDPPTAVYFPREPDHAFLMNLTSDLTAGVDPYTGRVLGAIDRQKGPIRFVHVLHTRFVAGKTGENLVGAFTVVTFLMAVSGVILWWPRRIWSVKSGRSWRRTNFDLHSVLGLYSAALLLVMTATGLLIAYERTLDPLLLRLDPAPALTPVRPASTVIAGATPIGPDEALRIGSAALPGAFVARINLPAPGVSVYTLGLKFPEDRTPGGRSRVAVDQYSGRVLNVLNTRAAAGMGTRILNLKRSIHTGDVFGGPSQALAFLVSLALAGQVITGFLIWWKPGRFAFATGRGRERPPVRASPAI